MTGSDAVGLSLAGTPDADMMRAPRVQWFFARMNPDAAQSLSENQKKAVAAALDDARWTEPPVNLRFSFPIFGGRYYLAVIGGAEKRSPVRRTHDRQRYPLRTLGNAFFLLGMATLFYLVALLLIAFHATIIEI